MWWNVLVARFLEVITKGLVALIVVVPGYANWSICNRQPRWKLKNSYPTIWMILSAVMLNNHFVQIIAMSHLHQSFTPSSKNSVSADPRLWLPPPTKTTPDAFQRTCKIKLSDHNKEKPPSKPVYNINTFNVTYSTLNAQQRNKKGALVDRGANGGVAGNDTRIINTHPTRKVDIQGIDNHRLPDIPIVTAGAVVKTQRGDVILVMNQYASVRTGKTIHSSGQLEAFGNSVDDKSIKTGGCQRIITPDGYIIPLQVQQQFSKLPNALLYLSLIHI